MRHILVIGIAAGLASCVATGPVWVKSGVTEAEASHVKEACQRQEDRRMREAGSYRYYEGDGSYGSDPIANAETDALQRQLDRAVEACMIAKGFKQAPRNKK